MIIAEQKRKENIAEYLLYMYQVEDMIRANGLDIESIEKTVESMVPEIANKSQASCPGCQTVNKISISPYTCFEKPAGELFNEIYVLDSNFHWSEDEILNLTSKRRRRYLSLIDQKRGIVDHKSAEMLMNIS